MRMIRRLTMPLGMLSFVVLPAARATDVPVVANKLVIIDKTARTGLAKAVLTAKDAAVTKGSGTDPANVSALLHVRYDSVGGQFAMPAGDKWVVNSASVAKYVNQDAPAGGSVKLGIIKPGALFKVVAKSLGDAPFDISQPPSGAVSVVGNVTNGSETFRLCAAFPVCAHKTIAGGTGWKLVCKGGLWDSSCTGFIAPVCGDGVRTAGESCDPPGSTCGPSLLCDGSCLCHLCGNAIVEEGEQCDVGDTVPGDGCDAFCQLEETAIGATSATTDDEGDGATPADPLETTVTAPVGGTITILETSAAGEPPDGLRLLARKVSIAAPIASATSPLVLEFAIDHALVATLSPDQLVVFRDGVAVAECTGSPGEAAPDPCVAARATTAGNLVVTVRTSQASDWGFGANVVFTLTSTSPVGTCGAVRAGGAGGPVVKSLTCGGLSVGGGSSTFAEARFPSGSRTDVNGTCDATSCVVSGRSSVESGSIKTCSQTGCRFGPFVPVVNAGTSVCLAHTFAGSASGTIDHTAGTFVGSLPLASAAYLTANAASPCPRCLGGMLGVAGSGVCDPNWQAGTGPSPDAGAACTPIDVAGTTFDCQPPAASLLPAITLAATPVTTGTAVLSGAGGMFCPSQATAGAFGCAGTGPAASACPGGNVPPVVDHIEAVGAPAGAITGGPHPIRLASMFCVPSVGGALGFLINGAANLPGPGAFTLPETLTVATATTSTSTTSTTLVAPFGTRLLLTSDIPSGACGSVRAGGAGGTLVKSLACGGTYFGGGLSTFGGSLMPGGATTQFDADCSLGPLCTIGALTITDTGSNDTCSSTGCRFGPYVPVPNMGTSVCLEHSFTAPASGTLDSLAGTFVGSLPLASAVYLTANGTSPCPKCLGGSPGVVDSGECDPTWLAGVGASPDAGLPCTPVNVSGATFDCAPPVGALLPSVPLAMMPTTTGVATLSSPGGLFCPGQMNAGAFGCAGNGGPANALCPGGNMPPVVDHIEVHGSDAGPLTPGGHPIRLASAFCVPSVGGGLGFLVNAAADLPGPGAVNLPATAELVP